MTIQEDHRAILTAVGGTQFSIDDNGMFPVVVSPKGRRLQGHKGCKHRDLKTTRSDRLCGEDGEPMDPGSEEAMAADIIALANLAAASAPHSATVISNGVVSTGNAVASSAKSTGKKIKKIFG
jgi:hypothetical protein